VLVAGKRVVLAGDDRNAADGLGGFVPLNTFFVEAACAEIEKEDAGRRERTDATCPTGCQLVEIVVAFEPWNRLFEQRDECGLDAVAVVFDALP